MAKSSFWAVRYDPGRAERFFAYKVHRTYSRKVAFVSSIFSRVYILVTVWCIFCTHLTHNCISLLYRNHVSTFYASLKIIRLSVKLLLVSLDCEIKSAVYALSRENKEIDIRFNSIRNTTYFPSLYLILLRAPNSPPRHLLEMILKKIRIFTFITDTI